MVQTLGNSPDSVLSIARLSAAVAFSHFHRRSSKLLAPLWSSPPAVTSFPPLHLDPNLILHLGLVSPLPYLSSPSPSSLSLHLSRTPPLHLNSSRLSFVQFLFSSNGCNSSKVISTFTWNHNMLFLYSLILTFNFDGLKIF
jgi:hypothetical protein